MDTSRNGGIDERGSPLADKPGYLASQRKAPDEVYVNEATSTEDEVGVAATLGAAEERDQLAEARDSAANRRDMSANLDAFLSPELSEEAFAARELARQDEPPVETIGSLQRVTEKCSLAGIDPNRRGRPLDDGASGQAGAHRHG